MPEHEASHSSKKNGWISHVLVTGQFTGILLCIMTPDAGPAVGSWVLLLTALPAVLLGGYTLLHNRIGNFGVYPELIQSAQLITSGPYRWIRHPMYSALLLLMLGLCLRNGDWINLVGLILVAASVDGKARREEKLLSDRFAAYSAYMHQTYRFMPGLY